MRRLQVPTLAQWTCAHQWKTTTSRPGQGDVVRVRYLTCQRCGLKVKTEERLAVPWEDRDFMALVEQAFPEDTIADEATLRAQGLFDGGVSQLNVHLVPHGWHLDLVEDQGHVVGVVRRRRGRRRHRQEQREGHVQAAFSGGRRRKQGKSDHLVKDGQDT